MESRRDADSRDGALARERRCSHRHRPAQRGETAYFPVPRWRTSRHLPHPAERHAGLERRPPAGLARERETSADDAAPCQREFPTLSQPRMAQLLTTPPYPGAAPFHDRRGVQASPIMGVSPRGGSTGDASRLNRPASRGSQLRFGRITPGPVLPVGAPPSRALSAGPPPGELAPPGELGLARLGAHVGSTTGW